MSFLGLAIVISLGQLAIGIAVGIWLALGHHPATHAATHAPHAASGETPPVPAERPPSAPADPVTAPPGLLPEADVVEAQQVLLALREFASGIEGFVDDHQGRVGLVSDRLQDLVGDAATSGQRELRGLMAEMLDANEQLKRELLTAQEQLRSTQTELDSKTREARSDGLTGLANRREFDETLARRLAEWARRGTPVSLVLVDVDHFKKFNDTHGHQAGDLVLSGVAGVLRSTMRDMDVVARYGGEEFAIILPSTILSEGQRAAQRLLAAVRQAKFPYRGLDLQVSASLGLAQAEPGEDVAGLVRRADAALYASKGAGRNRAHYHNGELALPVDEAQPTAGGGRPDVERRQVGRRPFLQRQPVAPYDGHNFPAPEAFQSVLCQDVSAGGISFVVDDRPLGDAVVVALGFEPHLRYMAAEIVYVLPGEVFGEEKFRVGCRFLGRIEPGAPQDADDLAALALGSAALAGAS